MYLLYIGLLVLLMKFLDIGPVGRLDWAADWYWFAAPFILAATWWAWADWSGYTKRRAMDKMDQRKKDRLTKNRDAMGMGPKKR